MKTFEEFLIEAKKQTYANSAVQRVSPARECSRDYHYETEIGGTAFAYHDTYFGTEKFMGEEVVYIDGKPVWGMNYYGFPLDEDFDVKIWDEVLRPALKKVGQDQKVLPLRGPSRFESGDFLYTFKTEGDIHNFSGEECISLNGKLVYRFVCFGGDIK